MHHARHAQVGELGVLKFGGPQGAVPLHPLGAPFSDAAGPGIVGGLRFDQVCARACVRVRTCVCVCALAHVRVCVS